MDALYERCRALIARSQATRNVTAAMRHGGESPGDFGRRLLALDMIYGMWTSPRPEGPRRQRKTRRSPA
jgi:hypothetical protein